MGLLDKFFNKPKQISAGGYKTFTESSPIFTSWDGQMYEQELTRSAIEAFSRACSKLKPELEGDATRAIKRIFDTQPNPLMTWSKFLARAATLYEVDATLAIIPALSPDGRTITGLFPLKFVTAEVVEYKGEPWIKFYLTNGEIMPIELNKVALISKFQYLSDIFGTENCLDRTLKLIHAQDQAQEAAIRNGAKIRFIGALSGQVREEDMEKKRDRFIQSNLSAENESGLMLYDATFQDIKQVQNYSYTIESAEMERIRQSVYTYFGVNEDILQNKFTEDVWAAYYEGKVEPFAVQLGDALTSMLFSPVEQLHGKRVCFSSNRLEYSSMASKRNMIRDMLDRGVFTINEARDVLQLPHVEGGDIRVIRGEYINADAVSTEVGSPNHEEDRDLGGDDDIYKDSDGYESVEEES